MKLNLIRCRQCGKLAESVNDKHICEYCNGDNIQKLRERLQELVKTEPIGSPALEEVNEQLQIALGIKRQIPKTKDEDVPLLDYIMEKEQCQE